MTVGRPHDILDKLGNTKKVGLIDGTLNNGEILRGGNDFIA
jgi:hypothetical protein